MKTPDDDSPFIKDDANPVPQTQGRRGQRQKQTRAQLIAGARNVFARAGVAEATIAQITSEANVGFGTFYLHFKTKEDVLHAVLIEGFAQLNTQVDLLLRHADEQQQPWEDTLKETVIAYLHFASENRDLIQIMLAEQSRGQQTDQLVFLRFAWRISLLLQSIQPSSSATTPDLASIPKGVPAYPLNLLTVMIVAILNRTAIWWLRQYSSESDEQSVTSSLDTAGALAAQFIIAGLTSVLTTHADNTRKDEAHDDSKRK